MPQWNDPAMHFFVEGNWVHYSRDFNATVMNEKGSSTATVDLEDFAEARLGAVMHFSDDFLVWGDFNLRSGERRLRILRLQRRREVFLLTQDPILKTNRPEGFLSFRAVFFNLHRKFCKCAFFSTDCG